jgi:hypothetical protein
VRVCAYVFLCCACMCFENVCMYIPVWFVRVCVFCVRVSSYVCVYVRECIFSRMYKICISASHVGIHFDDVRWCGVLWMCCGCVVDVFCL